MSKVLRLPPIDAYALWAENYDHTPNPMLSLEERHVKPLLPSMTGLAALDVACGTGRWLAELRRRGAASTMGLDLSTEMLQQARRRPEDVSLLQADAMEIPLQTASIDFAICSFAVSYMASIDRLARELSRVMRNQGQSCLVLTDIHPSAQARGWKRRFRHRGAIVEVSNFPRPIERTQQAFAAMGLEPVACLEPAFGETERPIFERCGKTAVFRQLLGQPAIIVLLFRRAQ